MAVIWSGLILGVVAALVWGRRPAVAIALWLPGLVFATLAAIALATGLRDRLLIGSLLVSGVTSLTMLVSGCGGVAAGLALRFALKIPMSGGLIDLYFPTRR